MLAKIAFVLFIGITITVKSQDLSDTTELDNRVKELISKFTIDEKIQTLSAGINDGIPRLGIPEYKWANECLHGLTGDNITVFPQSMALAATWNTKLMYRVASAISDEARARFKIGGNGLNFWSPNINIVRDPRWGRSQETYGEDPFLTPRMAVSYIKGLQGDDPKYFKTIASPKHFIVHSGPESIRHIFDAKVGARDFRETYMPAFKSAIMEAGAYSIMTSYNAVNGRPVSASSYMLQELLRDEWGFKGYVTTDCNALGDSFWSHKVGTNILDGTAIPLLTGIDLECGDFFRFHLKNAFLEGYVTEKDIEKATFRLYKAKFLLGIFDNQDSVKYNKIPASVIDSKEHSDLAVEAAKEAIVLLKNDGILPLKKDLKRILVVGPNGDVFYQNLGSYSGWPSKPVTILEGIKKNVSSETEVVFRKETEIAGSLTELITPLNLKTKDGQPGLLGEYFSNKSLSGEPVFTRIDTVIDFEWNDYAPVETITRDTFSVRWTGIIRVDEPGEYTFKVTSDDGTKLIIDSTLIINDFVPHGKISRLAFFRFEANRDYFITFEYLQSTGNSSVKLEFGNKNTGDKQQNELSSVASDFDVVIYVGGLSHDYENEEIGIDIEGFYGGDRTSLDLPWCQQKVIEALHRSGTPVVMVNLGTSLALNWHKENIPAILHIWYLAQAAGDAVSAVLFGDYNPAGRTPVTFYKSVNDLPDFEDYSMQNRTYRYFTGEPLYPFGYGLSYTNFNYSDFSIESDTVKLCLKDTLAIAYKLTNTGNYDGDEVVQLYVKNLDSYLPQARKQLKQFKRVHLKSGESINDTLFLNLKELYSYDTLKNEYIYETGRYELQLGASSEDIKHQGILFLDNCKPTNIKEIFNENIIKIYPNPASETINFEIKGFFDENSVIKIYDLLGNLIPVDVIYSDYNNTAVADCSGMPTGIYIAVFEKMNLKYYSRFSVIR